MEHSAATYEKLIEKRFKRCLHEGHLDGEDYDMARKTCVGERNESETLLRDAMTRCVHQGWGVRRASPRSCLGKLSPEK